MIRKTLTKPAVILALFFLLQWAALFAITTPAWDATFYYAYARSIVFDGDLHIDNDLRLSYPTTAPDFARKGLDQVQTETGRVASPFAIGSSLLWLPWLAFARLLAEIGRLLSLFPGPFTGYEWPFATVTAVLSALVGWLAFWIGFRLAQRETTTFSALAAAVTLLFTTPLLYYQYREPLYSHAASAFVTALCLYAWWRWRDNLSPRPALLIGGLIGLAGLIRWQHVVYLVLPFSSAVYWWWQQRNTEEAILTDKRKHGQKDPKKMSVFLSVRERLSFLNHTNNPWWQVLLYLALVGLAAAAVFSIQLTQWHLFYGTWLTVPQGGAYVDWSAPFWQPVLFSTYRGLLPWMPVVVPAIAGLIWLAKRKPALAVPLLLVLLLETYVNSSTRDWFGGGGFGPRRYTSELTILVIGYAAFLQAWPRPIRLPLASLLGAGLALHQWLLLRYGLIERIGGRNLTMYPTYQWVEGSLGEYVRALAAHLPALRHPLSLLIMPGSLLDALLNGHGSPTVHLLTLLAASLFLAACLKATHHLGRYLLSQPLWWLLPTAALLAFNTWLLLAA